LWPEWFFSLLKEYEVVLVVLVVVEVEVEVVFTGWCEKDVDCNFRFGMVWIVEYDADFRSEVDNDEEYAKGSSWDEVNKEWFWWGIERIGKVLKDKDGFENVDIQVKESGILIPVIFLFLLPLN